MRSDYSPAWGIIFFGGKLFYNGFIKDKDLSAKSYENLSGLFLPGQVVKLEENKFAYLSFRPTYYCLVEVNVF